MKRSGARRVCVAGAAVLIAGLLLHRQLSLAVVSRGDEFLYRGRTDRAVAYYARAMALDRDSDVAVDRYAFFRFEMRDAGAIPACLEAAGEFLSKRDDPTIRADRALCNLRKHRYHQAALDFRQAGYALHDSRYLAFAGWAELHAGNRRGARALLKSANALGFQPARETLRRLR